MITVTKHNLNKRPSFILTCQTTNSKCKRDRSCKRMFHLAHSHCLMLAAEKDKSGFPKREKPAAYTSSFNAPSWKGRNHTRLTIPARLVKRPSVKRPLKKRRRERATIQRQDPLFNFYDRSNLQVIGFHLYKCWQS